MLEKKNFTVIVSESCKRLTQGFSFHGLQVRFSDHIRETVFQLLRDFQGRRFHLLLILSPGEALGFDDLFKSYDPNRLSYAFAIMSAQEQDFPVLSSLDHLLDLRVGVPSELESFFVLKRAQEFFSALDHDVISGKSQERRSQDQAGDQEALISIGKALSLERDPHKLLRTILYMSKKITGADAGSLYVVEGAGAARRLRFKYSHTYSMDLSYEEFTIPIDGNSIAGYVALTGNTLNIPDVYALDEAAPVSFNDSFDKRTGYRTRSMLVTPMVNHLGQVIGVIQLINSKEAFDELEDFSGNEAFEIVLRTEEDFDKLVVPFDERYVDLMKAVSSQAAIAIENNRMILQIQRQFEEFVRASVTAIESRDPATSGHSLRVAHMSDCIARAINDTNEGPLKDVYFTPTQLKELNLSCLLHDFGKVYIDLELFMKAKKLLPKDLEILRTRLAVLYKTMELEFARREISLLRSGNGQDESALLQEKESVLETIRGMWNKILQLNEPAVVSAHIGEEVRGLEELAGKFQVTDFEGQPLTILTSKELDNLRVARGSLNDEERKVIQSHVVHTFNFVKNIPWPDEYKDIPDIASKHHEMLDGSGYPWGLTAENIPLGARIMAVADVFDALAATDRPYKKALPLEKVLAILKDEAEKGKLDKDLVELFLAKQLFEIHGKFEVTSVEQLLMKV